MNVFSFILNANYNYKIYAYTLNCSMNIKPTQYQKNPLAKSSSKKHHSKSIRPFLSPSSKQLIHKQRQKDEQFIKQSNEPQKKSHLTKGPPALLRQNTQDSVQDKRPTKNASYGQQIDKQQIFKDSKKKYQLMKQSKKINSDQQSTNAYRYNKQSADQQPDPYKLTSTNPFYKEKSIKPSRDLSITLMCNIQQKPKLNSHQITENLRTFKNQSPSIHDLKAQINKKIQSFKSLTKLHQQQNEYFTNKVGISKEQQKRLQKIQLIQINTVKNQIFHLRDSIVNISAKSK